MSTPTPSPSTVPGDPRLPHGEPTGAPSDVGSTQSIGQIVAGLTDDFTTLMRQEVDLAKAEVRQSAQSASRGAGLLGGAGVAGLMAVLFLSVAAWWALGHLIGNDWSALVVGLVWAIVAAAMALAGKKALTQVSGVPRTIESTKQIPDALKGEDHIR